MQVAGQPPYFFKLPSSPVRHPSAKNLPPKPQPNLTAFNLLEFMSSRLPRVIIESQPLPKDAFSTHRELQHPTPQQLCLRCQS